MGKERKSAGRKAAKHTPLGDPDAAPLRPSKRKAQPPAPPSGTKPSSSAVPHDLSMKILREARLQRAEVEAEEAAEAAAAAAASGISPEEAGAGAGAGQSLGLGLADSSDEDVSDDDDDFDAEDSEVALADGYVEAKNLDPADEALLARFMSKEAPVRRTLGDLIAEQIERSEAAKAAAAAKQADMDALTPKVIEVYTQVGTFLRRYKSGKLPKVFKLLPELSNWEDMLYLTKPEEWTPHAHFAATRIFASNLNAAMAQRYYAMVLFPAVRDDIAEHKKLNYHLYRALKKALYKAPAFYKAILPLFETSSLTLREGIIISSVVKKVSIPQIHSAAALYKIASMRYGPATSVFLRTLIDKRYTLPYRVLDALVDHFMGFATVDPPLPVIWHQSLLAFATRYGDNIKAEQKIRLRGLMRTHSHRMITPETRRVLFSAKRAAAATPAPGGGGGGGGRMQM